MTRKRSRIVSFAADLGVFMIGGPIAKIDLRSRSTMLRRLIDLILIVLLVIGGSLAWTTGRERSKLQSEFDRLVKATGDLPIGDPTKVHVVALPTGEPLHFAWRIYLPPKYPFVSKLSNGVTTRSNTTETVEFIGRVRFLEEDGELKVFDSFHGGSSRNVVADKNLTEFLRGRWDQIAVEQVGTNGIETIDPDDSAILLRLTIPEDMQAEARKKLKAPVNSTTYPVLFSLEIGTPNPTKAKTKPAGKVNR
jgi:hypothetical protein